MDNLKRALTSKKFYAAIVALVFLFVGERAGLTIDQVSNAVYVMMTYILGQGLADVHKG